MNDQYIYKYPVLYSAGQKRAYFNLKVFWRWIIFAAVHGLVTYFGTSHVSVPYSNSGRALWDLLTILD